MPVFLQDRQTLFRSKEQYSGLLQLLVESLKFFYLNLISGIADLECTIRKFVSFRERDSGIGADIELPTPARGICPRRGRLPLGPVGPSLPRCPQRRRRL